MIITEFNFPALILRFSNFYGECQPIYRIIPKTIVSILKGKKLNLHGGGLSSRSFIYIDDFSNAIFKAINLRKQNQMELPFIILLQAFPYCCFMLLHCNA